MASRFDEEEQAPTKFVIVSDDSALAGAEQAHPGYKGTTVAQVERALGLKHLVPFVMHSALILHRNIEFGKRLTAAGCKVEFAGNGEDKMPSAPPIREEDFPPGLTKERPKMLGVAETEAPIPLGESAFELLERNLPEPARLCDPWATEGLNIIAGRPKLGKTTMQRQKLAAAAIGGEFLDSKFTEPCKCAFLSLEEGALLCKAKFLMAGFPEESLAGIQLFFEWPRGREGVDLLQRYLTEHDDVRFVCIDSLTKFRVIPDVRVPAFMADYEAMSMLHEVTKRLPGRLIDVVHHTRKARSEDPIDDISGTYGLTAAVDSYVVLRHHSDGVLMYAGGRLWSREVSEYKLKRANNHRWEMLGAFLGLSDEQEDTLRRVKAAAFGLSGSTLAAEVGITKQSAWQRLDLLLEKGFVTKRMGKVYPK